MKNTGKETIRDYTFRETVSCPLKLLFLHKENYNDQRDDLFRRRTKRVLRESIARQYPNIRFTSDATEKAREETARWLKDENVSICGAVITSGSIRARLPILLKEGSEFTLIQIHGKALKGDPDDLFNRPPFGKSILRYLFKAAYRYYVVKSEFPEAEINCKFLFPLKSFRANSNHLYQRTQGADNIASDALAELKQLFVEVDGTRQVNEVMASIPGDVSHAWFSGNSMEQAVKRVEGLDEREAKDIVRHVHMGCKDCRFRKPENQHEKGCWELHFDNSSIKNRDKHLFELIGHHVQEERLIEEKYQENITQTRGLSDADKVIRHTEKKIAIYHRKAMQILDAKNQTLPLIFAKELLGEIAGLPKPLHFIDFEAATHPVPMEAGKRPYDPVLFQFSCHTLLENGDLAHTQWLDQETYSDPHVDIISQLKTIPGIMNGTIVQFSPFERQAFYKLYYDVKLQDESHQTDYQFLKKVLKVGKPDQKQRFFDISILLKDGYYNRFMTGGLSLKEILYAVLQAEDELRLFETTRYRVEEIELDLLKKTNGKVVDPYYQLSDERSRIRDGITAMHAYFCMKAGVLSERQRDLVPVLMKRYCSMDSLAVYLIYEHLTHLIRMNASGGDLVING